MGLADTIVNIDKITAIRNNIRRTILTVILRSGDSIIVVMECQFLAPTLHRKRKHKAAAAAVSHNLPQCKDERAASESMTTKRANYTWQ